jgi:hypothetical protein
MGLKKILGTQKTPRNEHDIGIWNEKRPITENETILNARKEKIMDDNQHSKISTPMSLSSAFVDEAVKALEESGGRRGHCVLH